MQQSEQINELSAALAKAQGQIQGAKKTSDNPFFKSKYADLSEVWDVCRKPLSDNGLSIVQMPEVTDTGEIVLFTQICHSSGQWIRGKYPIRPTKQDPQGYGSAITYARRYSLAPAVGVAQEDDDGNAASQPGKNTAKPLLKPDVKKEVFSQTVECLGNGDSEGLKQIWGEFSSEEKVELWALFSAAQRSAIKELSNG